MPPRPQRGQQRGGVHQRAARGVHQVGGRLHQGQLGRADQPHAARAELVVHGHHVRGGEQVLLAHRLDLDLLRTIGIQVLAPGHHVHAERPADLRHPPAQVPQADDAQPLALQPGADRLLPAAARPERRPAGPSGHLQPLVFFGNVPEQAQDEPPGQLGRGGAEAAGAAHGDPARGRRRHVDGRVGHARGDQQPQPRQPGQPVRVERRPLPHGHDDVVRLQRADQRLGPRDVLGEDIDLGQLPHRGPVRAGQRNLLIIIEDRDPHAPTLPRLPPCGSRCPGPARSASNPIFPERTLARAPRSRSYALRDTPRKVLRPGPGLATFVIMAARVRYEPAQQTGVPSSRTGAGGQGTSANRSAGTPRRRPPANSGRKRPPQSRNRNRNRRPSRLQARSP